MKAYNKKRTKLIWVFAAITALICCALLYFLYPSSIHNRDAARALDQFYQAFIKRDYATISKMMEDGNPQFVINERHWYGEVKRYQILYLLSMGTSRKKALVRVTTIRNEKEETYYDTLKLKKRDQWLMESYSTNLKYNMP
ncbi:hypothetical protein QJ48_06900 [Paenibacillus sp. A3]|uniref:hypothetical protein n=1 Tax=Paenibacillus sp. A3 TaxID=1337054 RepID=UPI0006D5401E|nr:hypothetical protein [Paenibacillus sp. A3]KPV60232.1 hypothetical protein QJ48_06900 [Paenibacillus sp. A3]